MLGTKNIIIEKWGTKSQKKSLEGLIPKWPIFIGIKNIFKPKNYYHFQFPTFWKYVWCVIFIFMFHPPSNMTHSLKASQSDHLHLNPLKAPPSTSLSSQSAHLLTPTTIKHHKTTPPQSTTICTSTLKPPPPIIALHQPTSHHHEAIVPASPPLCQVWGKLATRLNLLTTTTCFLMMQDFTRFSCIANRNKNSNKVRKQNRHWRRRVMEGLREAREIEGLHPLPVFLQPFVPHF